MTNLKRPSNDFLIPRKHRIKAIQNLYEKVSNLITDGNNHKVLDATVNDEILRIIKK